MTLVTTTKNYEVQQWHLHKTSSFIKPHYSFIQSLFIEFFVNFRSAKELNVIIYNFRSSVVDPHFSRVSTQLVRLDLFFLWWKISFWKSRSRQLFYFIFESENKTRKKNLKEVTP